ncbi:copper radical oxidase [Fomitiporia mediterranea MF3/22]|uniref:copper radical oxidase n=1 Tax=Fomitiporia mediterranea (strain MF3/22) TaxID=694068 RepID=UPI0004409118|nr:copper radical oxidase [Fomitiporia mediterranea MF3/22]EJD05922.1 copper radical oxidase [Fomitiporia mediterranea MF3/22]
MRALCSAFAICGLIHLVYSRDSAWNGHVSPGSTTPAKFTPFYVPSGSKQIDSDDPAIRHSRAWKTIYSPAYVNGSALSTTQRDAYATYTFSGTGIELYGSKGKHFGKAAVFIDGKLAQTINNYASQDQQQQLLFSMYSLTSAAHEIKIVNKGSTTGSQLQIDAFVVTSLTSQTKPVVNNEQSPTPERKVLVAQTPTSGEWLLTQNGSTGVAAMQLAIISSSHAIIIDKVEHNPLTIDGHPAWGALYNLNTHAVKALHMKSNSFCAGGTFLSNGTLINVGGNPVVSDKTAAADFGDVDGLQAIRLFHPCDSDSVVDCDIYENHTRIRMASPRWYNTVIRLSDGSAMIIGGSKKGGWMNNATTNNPTVEYYPPKDIKGSNGLPITLPFLKETLNSNLFPIAFSLPDGRVFISANEDATIYDWKTNSERRLPQIPNGVRVTYPMTGTGLLLPLSAENKYTPEILLCGGSAADDTKPGYELNSQDPASSQCSRLVLTEEGIAAGWQVEQMPQPRVMPDAVLLPTGEVLIVNGGASGISGYANVIGQVGQSNADNPVLMPVLYDPSAAAGSRFSSSGMPTSAIPRLYHSVATLTPSGAVMIAGSNPNLDRSEVKYGTEYRVEWLYPPYMNQARPTIAEAPDMIGFGGLAHLRVQWSGGAKPSISDTVKIACMDLGYVTHAVHANSRLVYLEFKHDPNDASTLLAMGPPSGEVYPPGPAWLFVVVNGVPSEGKKVLIGDGAGPEVNEAALKNMLEKTQVDQYEAEKKGDEDDSE